MAYLKPNGFTQRVFNPIAMKFGLGGSETLAIARRRSAGMQMVPVIPVEHDGARYLVSTRGESEWVKNLRAAGGGEITGKGGTSRFIATEVPLPERGPILERYKQVAGKTVAGYFKALPDPVDHPVFRLDRAR